MTAGELGIPEGIREVVGRRLDRLSEDANAALSMAAVVGRDFDLAAVTTATDLDEEVVESGLDHAVRARLIEETGVGEYRFSHALVRSTLYDELRATKRARMHGRVATAMEAHQPEDAAALAHHLVQAGASGDLDKAVRYLRVAGEEAMEQLAHDRAVDYYRQALELLEGVAEKEADRCAVMVCLGVAQRDSGDAAFRRTLLDAAAEAQGAGLREPLVRAALANSRGFWSMAGEIDTERIAVVEAALDVVGDDAPADRAQLMAVLAAELMFSDADERRYALSDDALTLARSAGDPQALVDVLLMTVPTNYVPWRIDFLAGIADEMCERAAALGEPVRLAKATLWGWIARMMAGNLDEVAAERFATARRIADELGQPTLRWLVSSWDAFRLQMLGDLPQAEAQLNSAFELGQRTGQPDAFTWYAGMLWLLVRERGEIGSLTEMVEAELERNPGLPAWSIVLGMAYCERERHDDTRALIRGLVDESGTHFPNDVMWVCAVVGLLDLAETVGDTVAAEHLYDALLPYRDQSTHGGICYLGSAERYLGIGARALGRLDDAVAHGEAAVERERSMGTVMWAALAAAELAVTLRRRGSAGDLPRADELAREALETARRTGSVYIEQRLARPSA